MALGKFIAVLLLAKVSNTLYVSDEYRIPEPVIEVLEPQGLRISIDDIPGTSYVSFHVHINKYSRSEEKFIKELSHAIDGNWTFEEHHVRLYTEDKIYYSIYVTHKKLRFGTGEKVCKIKELPHTPLETPSVQQPKQLMRPLPCQASNNKQFETYSTTAPPQTTTDSYLATYQQLLLNCSQNLATLQAEIETLKKENQQLTRLIHKDLDAKKLNISGRIPPNGEPVFTATFLIREKLDLNPDIISAVRKNNASIEFEVATLAEKLEILEAAKDKLKNSTILIS